MNPECSALLDNVFRKYRPALVRFASTRGIDGAAAEDVAHSAILAYAERLEQGKAPTEDTAIRSYLFRSVVNGAISHTARHTTSTGERRTEDIDGIIVNDEQWEPRDSAAPVYSRMEQEERELHVHRAIAALPEKQQTAVIMHHLQGMEVSEIAQRLGVPYTSIQGRLHSGRCNLRASLSKAMQ